MTNKFHRAGTSLLALLLLGILTGCQGRGPGGFFAARAPDPTVARLVGTWRGQCVVDGIPIAGVTTLRADGTYTATAQALGGARITDSGRWTYQNGVVTATSALIGTEQYAVTWTNQDQFRSTLVFCTLRPDLVGLVGFSTRVRFGLSGK